MIEETQNEIPEANTITHVIYIDTGSPTCEIREEFEMPEDATEEEIEEEAEEILFQYITWCTIPLSEDEGES